MVQVYFKDGRTEGLPGFIGPSRKSQKKDKIQGHNKGNLKSNFHHPTQRLTQWSSLDVFYEY